MGGCCSKDSGGRGKQGLFHVFSDGEGEDAVVQHETSPKRRRRPANPSFKERLLALHTTASSFGRDPREECKIGGPSSEAIFSVKETYEIGVDDPFLSSSTCAVDSARGASYIPRAHKANTKACQLRGTICSSPLDLTECACFVPPAHPKSKDEAEFIREALGGNFVFADVGDEATKILVNAFAEVCVPMGEELMRRGESGDYFYIIQNGSVVFRVNSTEIGTAGIGDSFGELSLLYDCPRAATCVATANCVLWRVGQGTFRTVLAKDAMKKGKERLELMRKLPFLEQLDDETLTRVSEVVSVVNYEPGDTIFRKGDEGNSLYVVKSGRVRVTDAEVGQSKYDDAVYGPGEYFGESALVEEEKRCANVTAIDDVTLLLIRKDDFNRVLGGMNELVMMSNDKRLLMSMPLFKRSGVFNREIAALARKVQVVEFPTGHVFFTEGQILENNDRSVYIVHSGRVTATTTKGQIHDLTYGGYFGDGNVGKSDDADDDLYVVAKVTVKVAEACTLGVLSMPAMEAVLGRGLSRLSKVKEGESHPTRLDRSIKMEELKKHKILGVGAFGKVWLVSKSAATETEIFALKIQNKRELIRKKQVDNVVREKNIMASIDSPFIIRLFNTYQDKKYLYMLMQLARGGELFSAIHTETRSGIPESDAKFYAAGILEGLVYMHQRQIIYRDLKPENVLLDTNGYTVITDLGFAKIVENKTYTLCGTPLYFAPEVILSRGYDRGADFWSWGILIYEMIFGLTPFYEHDIEQLQLFKKIVMGRFLFPVGKVSAHARDIIKKLLSTHPLKRLGCLAGAEKDIHEHDWFIGFDLGKLARKETAAPWRPKLNGEFDVTNFDDWSHVNTQMDLSLPLSAQEQELFSDF